MTPAQQFNCPVGKQCENKCQLCGNHPAKHRIKNKLNGKELKICDHCIDYVGIGKEDEK